MNYADMRRHDVANGPGVRATLYVSGCSHNCKGCFNTEQQDHNYGTVFSKEHEDRLIHYGQDKNVVGVSILGGEPFQQDMTALISTVKRIIEEVGKPIWVWSGYTVEQIHKLPRGTELLKLIDVPIDGKYEQGNRDISAKYKGSTNQRVIDVKETIKENKIVLY